MAISDFADALLRIEDNDMLPEERAVAHLTACCHMLEKVYGENCAELFHEFTERLLASRSERTWEARLCCPEETCGNHQNFMRFLDSWGIEPSLGIDNEGHYAEFSIPTSWSMEKRERFIKELRKMAANENCEE